MTRLEGEALEHALADIENTTHELYCLADYESKEGRAKLLEQAKQVRNFWNEVCVGLEKEVK